MQNERKKTVFGIRLHIAKAVKMNSNKNKNIAWLNWGKRCWYKINIPSQNVRRDNSVETTSNRRNIVLIKSLKFRHIDVNERETIHINQNVTCLRWFFKMVPSGSGKTGISSFEPVGGESLFESRSTSQISSGNLQVNSYDKNQRFFYIQNLNATQHCLRTWNSFYT